MSKFQSLKSLVAGLILSLMAAPSAFAAATGGANQTMLVFAGYNTTPTLYWCASASTTPQSGCLSGLTASCVKSIDGGSSSATTNSPSEIATTTGLYKIALTGAETQSTNTIVKCSATNMYDFTFVVNTTLALGRIVVTGGASGDSVAISTTVTNANGMSTSGNGTGAGLSASGGSSGGAGITAAGGASGGNGIVGTGGTTGGNGMSLTGGSGGSGNAQSNGFLAQAAAAAGHGLAGISTVGSGIAGFGGSTGAGILGDAGTTGAAGIKASGSSSNAIGLQALGGTAGGVGLQVSSNLTAVNAASFFPLSGNADAVLFTGSGNGAGLHSVGGTSGNGATLQGGATSGNGLNVSALGGNNHGFLSQGHGSSDGFRAVGGATGNGIEGQGGATSGHGIVGAAQAGNSNGFLGSNTGTGVITNFFNDPYPDITGAPVPASTNFGQAIGALMARFFNNVTQTKTQQKVFKADDSSVACTEPTSDDGTTQTKGRCQ